MSSPSKEVRRQYYLRNRERILAKEKEKYKLNTDKVKKYQKEYRLKNKSWINEKNIAKRKEKLNQLVQFLGNVCAHCNNSFPNCVYDFHHIDPTKKLFTIGEHMYKALHKLKEEASKCILLCSNCHRIAHDN